MDHTRFTHQEIRRNVLLRLLDVDLHRAIRDNNQRSEQAQLRKYCSLGNSANARMSMYSQTRRAKQHLARGRRPLAFQTPRATRGEASVNLWIVSTHRVGCREQSLARTDRRCGNQRFRLASGTAQADDEDATTNF